MPAIILMDMMAAIASYTHPGMHLGGEDRIRMHPKAKDFANDLHEHPPADLAEWLGGDAERRADHFREFDLDDLSNPNHAKRVEDAEKVLPELVRRAQKGRTISFTDFVEVAGRGNKRQIGGKSLNPIVALCLTRDLPPLWTLVVNAGTGLGSGYWRERSDEQKIARQEACFAFYNASRAEPLPMARTARRQPTVVIRDVCQVCNTERTPTGACLC